MKVLTIEDIKDSADDLKKKMGCWCQPQIVNYRTGEILEPKFICQSCEKELLAAMLEGAEMLRKPLEAHSEITMISPSGEVFIIPAKNSHLSANPMLAPQSAT